MKKRNTSQAGERTQTETHTPAPWRAEESHYTAHQGDHVAVFAGPEFGSGKFDVQIANMHPWPNRERAIANARLIAAAPELLAALTKIIDRLDSFGSLSNSRADQENFFAPARAAIAKTLEGSK